MRSLHHAKCGNFNLRGKLTLVASCKCCVLHNLKRKEIEKLLDREMRSYGERCIMVAR